MKNENNFGSLIGNSQFTHDLRSFIQKAAVSKSNVYIYGETGTGKDLTAKLIHEKSPRNNRPFVKINCANINDELFESEIFGHKKGAFTGAVLDKPGLLEAANGGTVFFNEICDASPKMQIKLLTVIEDYETRRIGESVIRKLDVRFIFASNRDPIELINRHEFRSDLFFRISILSYKIAPLRERKEDILPIVKEFLSREQKKNGISFRITKRVIRKLIDYDYPGNIRELEYILKRAFEMATNDVIEDVTLNSLLSENHLFGNKYERLSSDKINNALRMTEGNKTKAAAYLGISRVHLHRLLKKY
jgi:transcriptional regulator with PAS, ATPase and Fis domain